MTTIQQLAHLDAAIKRLEMQIDYALDIRDAKLYVKICGERQRLIDAREELLWRVLAS